MITRIHIERFKSYRTASLPLAPLTLLIGANASGKSNAIEAIRLLSLLAQGRRLEDIFQSVQREDVAIRGTIQNLTYDREPGFGLGCSLTDPDVGEWEHFRIDVQVERREMRILQEHIESEKSTVPLYKIEDPAGPYSREVQVAYNNFARGGKKPRIPCTDRQAIFTQLEVPSRFSSSKAREIIPRVVTAYQRTLRQVLFLDPHPGLMRTYSFVTDNELLGDGRNLSSVLYDLCEVQGRKEQVLAFIRQLPEQDIHDIRFLETPRSEVMVQLTETFAGQRRDHDAPVLSDGTLRVLAVAAALLSAPEGALVVIEEIDNGVHPSRAGSLLNNIQEVAQERGLRVLLTSHNPALLDTLPDEAVPDVVCCYRDPQQGDSKLVQLEHLQDYPELVARGPLGQLMTQGILERVVKDQRSPRERQEAALDWLEAFQAQAAGS